MKRHILFLSVLLSGLSLSAQKFQATIKQGSGANTVKVFVRPDATIAGTMSTLQFCLVVGSTVVPAATAAVANSPYVWSPVSTSTKSGGGNSYNAYTFFMNASPSVNFVSGTEYEIAEISFSGGPLTPQNVGLACFPDDGTIDYFNISIGTTPDIVNVAAPFYGTGANNSTWLTNFSIVQVGGIALPVKFLSFYAIKNGDNAKLSWSVENDENNKQFDVERSTDGRNFKPHATVAAKANGKSTNTYEVADYNLSKVGAPVIYYRIKQVDKNGEIAFSNIRNLNADRNGVPASIFPNPAKSSTRLLLDAAAAGKASVVIRDMHGKMVKQVNFQMIQGFNQQDINISELSSGEYSVSVMGENFNHQLKLTKIR